MLRSLRKPSATMNSEFASLEEERSAYQEENESEQSLEASEALALLFAVMIRPIKKRFLKKEPPATIENVSEFKRVIKERLLDKICLDRIAGMKRFPRILRSEIWEVLKYLAEQQPHGLSAPQVENALQEILDSIFEHSFESFIDEIERRPIHVARRKRARQLVRIGWVCSPILLPIKLIGSLCMAMFNVADRIFPLTATEPK